MTTTQHPQSLDLFSSLHRQHQDLTDKHINFNGCHSYVPPLYHHHHRSFMSPDTSTKGIRLDMCTESLGSETGTHDNSNDLTMEHRDTPPEYSPVRRKSHRQRSLSFPPPLSSASRCLHINSHRENGRLVLRAVTLPRRNRLEAERSGGRLRLWLLPNFDDIDNANQPAKEGEEEHQEALNGGIGGAHQFLNHQPSILKLGRLLRTTHRHKPAARLVLPANRRKRSAVSDMLQTTGSCDILFLLNNDSSGHSVLDGDQLREVEDGGFSIAGSNLEGDLWPSSSEHLLSLLLAAARCNHHAHSMMFLLGEPPISIVTATS